MTAGYDIAHLNSQASLLTAATIQASGTLPDPRAAVEALATGSTPDLVAALQSGSTAAASILSSTPIGQAPQASTYGAAQLPKQSDPWVMTQQDWQLYNQRIKAAKMPAMSSAPFGPGGLIAGLFGGPQSVEQQPGDASWASFGAIPLANRAWYEAQVRGDAKTVKKWQAYLNHQGFLPDGQKLEVSGVWDDSTRRSFDSFMISHFTPEAIYGKNEVDINRARSFLTALGVNPDDLQSKLRSDPEFRTQVVARWLHTQGPDVKMRQGLETFAKLYGSDNIPKTLQSLREDFWTKLGDGLGVLPVIGNIAALPISALETHHVGLDSLYRKTSDLEASLTESKLNGAEKDALAPALQDAHNAMGFMGFLDVWDQVRTKAVLATSYFFGDLFGKGKTDNVFDSASAMYRGAEAHKDNMMAGFFGDKWAHENPWLATIGNIAANITDDPLTYLGGVGLLTHSREVETAMAAATKGGGELSTLGKVGARVSAARSVRAQRSAARLTALAPRTIRDAMQRNALSQHLIDTALRPREALRLETARLMGEPGMTVGQAARMLGGTRNMNNLPKIRQILAESDLHGRVALLEEHFGHLLHSPDHAFNIADSRKMFLPDYFRRLSQGKQVAMLASSAGDRTSVGSMIDRSPWINYADPFETDHYLSDAAMVAGMDEPTLAPILDRLYTDDENEKRQAISDFREAWEAAFEKSHGKQALVGLRAFSRSQAERRGLRTPSEGGRMYLPIYDATGHNVIEGSLLTTKYEFKTGDAAMDKMLTEQADDMRAAVGEFQHQANAAREQMVADRMDGRPDTPVMWEQARSEVEADPEWQHQQFTWAERIKDVQDAMRALPGRRGFEGTVPAAAFSGQFGQWAKLEFTPYEVLAYLNPALRHVESLQSKMQLDKYMGLWKRIVLSKPSTSGRINIGDEYSRGFIKHLLDGGPLAGARYFADTMKSLVKRGHMGPMPKELAWSTQKLLDGLYPDDFPTHIPGALGYTRALTHHVTDVIGRGSPEAETWSTAMREGGPKQAIDDLETWLRGDSPEAKEFVRRSQLTSTSPEVRTLAQGLHQQLLRFTNYDPTDRERTFLFNWIDKVSKGGAPPDARAIREWVGRNQGRADVLPLVVGRRMYAEGTRGVGRVFTDMTDRFQHGVTDALVNASRRHVYRATYEENLKQVRAYHPTWTEHEVEAEAQDMAAAWVRKNTYQGQRSMMATASRNVFPFWGATANFNRFMLRQAAKHPVTVRPGMEVLYKDTQAQTQGGVAMPLPGSAWLMGKLGFTKGDDLTWDPGHAFFFTAEGYGGFIPGLGPVFMTPLKHFAATNTDLNDALKQVPGFEFVGTDTPIAPWAEDIASGIGLATVGKPFLEGIPLVGRPADYYEKKVLQAERAGHAAYLEGQAPETSPQQATSEVSRESLVKGVLSGAVPVSPNVEDPRAAALRPALQAWDAAANDVQKQQVLAKYPDAAPLLRYYDARTSSDEQRTIAAQHPWVQAYATGITKSTSAGAVAGSEATINLYHQDIASGRLSYLTAPGYLDKLEKNDQYNDAWGQYTILDNDYKTFLIDNGLSPTSKEAAAYRAKVLDPGLEVIRQYHQDWAQQFAKQYGTGPVALYEYSQPLQSLMTWEVIPQNGDFETPTTQAWRQALIWKDEAATALRELVGTKGSAAEQQQVLDQLASLYQGLAAQDPTFAAQIAQFRYKSIDDLVTLEAKYGMAAA